MVNFDDSALEGMRWNEQHPLHAPALSSTLQHTRTAKLEFRTSVCTNRSPSAQSRSRTCESWLHQMPYRLQLNLAMLGIAHLPPACRGPRPRHQGAACAAEPALEAGSCHSSEPRKNTLCKDTA